MGTTIRMIFLAAVFVSLYVMQWNLDSDITANRYVKNYLELALHDAALEIDTDEMAEGYVVFDVTEGTNVFNERLRQTMELESGSFLPSANSFFQDEVNVLFLDFIDEKTPIPENPSMNISFPYAYENEDFEILEVLNGPSVIAVVETQSPRFFQGEKKTIRKAVVYEYRTDVIFP